ncbi:MAG: hypothetical protein M5R41_06310 [Bacteroidia bacterium]|nr:hypothetical protein [Bacteroidia bacterium]
MTNDSTAFFINTNIPSEILADFAEAVESIDDLALVIDVENRDSDQTSDLSDVLIRGTKYLRFLHDRITSDDLVDVAPMPLDEAQRRSRISKLLRTVDQGALA